MNKIEEVAKAICLEQYGSEEFHGDARCCQAGGAEGCCKESLYPEAKAAIKAMLEPTDRMAGAGDSMMPLFAGEDEDLAGQDVAVEVYNDMIQAALEEGDD